MEQARRFLDLAFDFLILAMGLGVLMAGMAKVHTMQEQELGRTLGGGGRLTYVSDEVQECSGGDVIALLLGHDYTPVMLNGHVYDSGQRQAAAGAIDPDAVYTVERTYDGIDYSTPAMLIITKN